MNTQTRPMNLDRVKRTCNVIVDALVGAEFSSEWWSSPNLAFRGKTPDEQWEISPDVVFDYLTNHAFGGGYS